MPAPWVYEASGGVLVVYNGVTRATRIAKMIDPTQKRTRDAASASWLCDGLISARRAEELWCERRIAEGIRSASLGLVSPDLAAANGGRR